jgi:hypothetical protein
MPKLDALPKALLADLGGGEAGVVTMRIARDNIRPHDLGVSK